MMNEVDRQKLVRAYSTWEDSALLTALTTGRGQFRPDVMPLLEAEAAQRKLPIPPPPCAPASPTPQRRGSAAAAFVLRNLRWSRLSWIGRGYLLLLLWIFLPMIPALITWPVEMIFRLNWNEGNSPVYAMTLLMFVTVPTGFIGLMTFTIVVLVARWKRLRQGEGCQPEAGGHRR